MTNDNLEPECLADLNEIADEFLKEIYENENLSLISDLRGEVSILASEYNVDEEDLYKELYEIAKDDLEHTTPGEDVELSLYEIFELICPDCLP